jgi:hypothetical protein
MRLSSTGSFGSNDRPICAECEAAMHLIRRGPHLAFGHTWEQQIFACSKCLHEVARSADVDGRPHAA